MLRFRVAVARVAVSTGGETGRSPVLALPVGVQGADVAGFGLWEAFFGEGDGPLAGVYGPVVLSASQGQI